MLSQVPQRSTLYMLFVSLQKLKNNVFVLLTFEINLSMQFHNSLKMQKIRKAIGGTSSA